MSNDILVSIVCNTYNHEDYISDAIESFLMQKTNFKYEILIHDDASTDKTAEIIKEYEKKHPNIIKPIYQKENQHSKGVKFGKINRDRANGKYYALCEGDDYWTDPYKLQKQVDYLEKNPDCSVCVHAALMIDSESGKTIKKIRPSLQSREFSIEEVIDGGGGLFATNSMVYKRYMGSIRPDFYYKNKTSFSDYQLMILLALLGKVYFIDEDMSVYRYNVPGSWSSRTFSDTKKESKHIKDIIDMLDNVNEDTGYKYDEVIQKTKRRNEFSLLINQGKLKEAKSGVYKNYYKSLSIKSKISLNLKCYFPSLHKRLSLYKRKMLYGR